MKDPVVGIMDVPPLTCAVFYVECTADQLQGYYRSIYKDWLPDSGMQPADFPCYEVYLQTPEQSPEGLFKLDIHIPVKQLT